MHNKNEAREKARAKFNVSSHVKNHSDEQFIETFNILKTLDVTKFTDNASVALAIEKKHSTLTHDTIEDVQRMLKNAQNEKFMQSLKIDTAFVVSFFNKVRIQKFSQKKNAK
jgi:hypothetical protein